MAQSALTHTASVAVAPSAPHELRNARGSAMTVGVSGIQTPGNMTRNQQ